MKEVPIVDVVIITFNHEKYIKSAIQSVIDQQTTFNYKIIIGDDCSNDLTSKICSEYYNNYPDRIVYYRNKINLGLVKNYQKAFSLCSGKYISILEGDDYWTDTFKIEKQIQILEKDQSIGLVHSNCDKLFEDGSINYSYGSRKKEKFGHGYIFKSLIKENIITPLTVCFRKSILDDYVNFDDYVEMNAATIDYPLWVEIAYHSKVHFMEDSIGVYRVLSNSLSNSKNFKAREAFTNKSRIVMKYLTNKYNFTQLNDKAIDEMKDFSLAKKAIIYNNQVEAKRYSNLLFKANCKYFILKLLTSNKVLFKITYVLSQKFL